MKRFLLGGPQCDASCKACQKDGGRGDEIENPAPRNDPDLASYWPARAHLPQLWDMPRMRRLG